MNIKETTDIISKKTDIIKIKTFGFMAIAGGAFVSSFREDISLFLVFGIWGVFILGGYGTAVNFIKLTEIYKELEGIEK